MGKNGQENASVELHRAEVKNISTKPKRPGQSAYAEITLRIALDKEYRESSDFLMALQESSQAVDVRLAQPSLALVEG